MRLALLLLMIPLAFAQDPEITYALRLDTKFTCPGDNLALFTYASNGQPAPGIELRIVLHEPYQGLRALKTTDDNGYAYTTITKPGKYRVYAKGGNYNIPDFFIFDYPELCPAPPPESFLMDATPDCNASLVFVNISYNKNPVPDVIITTEQSSATTGASGVAALPLEEGYYFIRAEKEGFAKEELFVEINCTIPPPPECLDDADCEGDQFCFNGSCINITGECGYADDHFFVKYECCADSECGYKMLCKDHFCESEPEAKTNGSTSPSNESMENGPEESPDMEIPPLPVLILAGILIVAAIIFTALKTWKR